MIKKFKIVVMLSGRGSNFKAILDFCSSCHNEIEVVAVVSDNPNSEGLHIARHNQIPIIAFDPTIFVLPESFDKIVISKIKFYNPDLIVLAGFMRILSKEFTDCFKGNLINIHPSLLPKFKGLNTHKRAFVAGEKEHGASVHFVSEELDGGPVISQAKLLVIESDTPTTLASRVLELEHQLLPKTIKLIMDNKITLKDNSVCLHDYPLKKPLSLIELDSI